VPITGQRPTKLANKRAKHQGNGVDRHCGASGITAAVKTTSCRFPHCHRQQVFLNAAAGAVGAIQVIMTEQHQVILARKQAKDQGNGGDSHCGASGIAAAVKTTSCRFPHCHLQQVSCFQRVPRPSPQHPPWGRLLMHGLLLVSGTSCVALGSALLDAGRECAGPY